MRKQCINRQAAAGRRSQGVKGSGAAVKVWRRAPVSACRVPRHSPCQDKRCQQREVRAMKGGRRQRQKERCRDAIEKKSASQAGPPRATVDVILAACPARHSALIAQTKRHQRGSSGKGMQAKRCAAMPAARTISRRRGPVRHATKPPAAATRWCFRGGTSFHYASAAPVQRYTRTRTTPFCPSLLKNDMSADGIRVATP